MTYDECSNIFNLCQKAYFRLCSVRNNHEMGPGFEFEFGNVSKGEASMKRGNDKAN